MDTRKMRIDTPCPACRERTLEYTAAQLDVPYFGNILQTVFICGSCGFRHSDVIIGTTREPRRFWYKTRNADDMAVRIVRSTSGTVKIPELGVLIEPGPASEAFVSNIEGILERVSAVLDQLWRDAETLEQKQACEKRIEAIHEARRGTLPITVVLEDPYGNSLIAHEDAQSEPIPAEEAEQLPRGELTIDMRDITGNGAPP